MKDATGTVPRLRALLVLQAQQLQAFLVRLFPVLAAVLVVLDVIAQGLGQRVQLLLFHELGDVGLKVIGRRLTGLQADLQPVDADVDFLGVHDLNLNRGLLFCSFINAHGGGIQTFFDTHIRTFQ